MIIDQQVGAPASYIVGGANHATTFPRNAAAFILLDIYREVITFALKVAQRVRFCLEH